MSFLWVNHSDHVIRSVKLEKLLRCPWEINLLLICLLSHLHPHSSVICNVIPILILNDVWRDLWMLRDNQILVLKDISVLVREPLHNLIHRIFDLLREVPKDELVADHQRVYLLLLHLQLKRKVVLNRCHLCQWQELVYFSSVLVVIIRGNQQIARHFVPYLFNLPELVYVENLVFLQVLSYKDCHFHFVNDPNLRLEFDQVLLLFFGVSVFLRDSWFWSTACLFRLRLTWRTRGSMDIVWKDFGPKLLKLCFSELIYLFVAWKHPVIDIFHMPRHNHLHIFLRLVQSGGSLELFRLWLV